MGNGYVRFNWAGWSITLRLNRHSIYLFFPHNILYCNQIFRWATKCLVFTRILAGRFWKVCFIGHFRSKRNLNPINYIYVRPIALPFGLRLVDVCASDWHFSVERNNKKCANKIRSICLTIPTVNRRKKNRMLCWNMFCHSYTPNWTWRWQAQVSRNKNQYEKLFSTLIYYAVFFPLWRIYMVIVATIIKKNLFLTAH